jgi:hypothetical protein
MKNLPTLESNHRHYADFSNRATPYPLGHTLNFLILRADFYPTFLIAKISNKRGLTVVAKLPKINNVK